MNKFVEIARQRYTQALACIVAVLAIVACCALVGCGGSAAQGEEYTIDVTLGGGSGRASAESPAKIVKADDGSMTATVVWSSSFYDKMVVDGKEYKPINTEGNSTFEIPVVALDEDLPVQAETTKMGAPHMIDYTLHFDSASMVAADGSAPAKAESSDAKDSDKDGDAEDTHPQVANFHNDDIGTGDKPTKSLELKYAENFTVDYFDGGYKLACLSDGTRYLTVPEGKQAPKGLSKDIVVLQQPLDHIYLCASDTMCLVDAIDAIDNIKVSGIKKEDWYIPAAAKAMEDGKLIYGGKYSTPDYDVMLANDVTLAIESTMINHSPEVKNKLEELGIKVMIEQSSFETEPLARTEWVKLYGALLDKEDAAEKAFAEQEKILEDIDAGDVNKTVAFFYINTNGAAVVRKPGDYVTKMIKMAGGDYIFKDLDANETGMSTVTLEMEQFYATAKNCDVIIYNGTIDGGIDSIDELASKNELLRSFKAVKDGNVWCTEQNMYQQMMQSGAIIADFHKAFTDPSANKLDYLYRLS